MNDIYYVIQYRTCGHDDWKDDNVRPGNIEGAKARIERCRSAKIFKGAQWRIVKRTDEPVLNP